MKIMIISDMVGGPGGAYKYIRQIEEYKSPGVETRIIFDLVTSGYVNKNYNFQLVNFVPLSYKFHSESIIIGTIQKLLKEYKPDVIHIINGSIKSNLIIRKHFINEKIPFIVTEQFIDSSLKLEEKLLEEIRIINSKTRRVIYVSESNRNIANNIFKVYCRNNSVIYNAISPIEHKKASFSPQPFQFYTVARCVPQKGIDIIIKALSKISARKIHFHIIGDGEYKTEYINLASSFLKNNHEFKILGWKEDIDYSFISENYDLFISASRQEGMSYSILEAASLGMPIICSNASGNNELIKICDCGSLFNVDNYDELADLLLDFINDPSVLNKKAVVGSKKIDSIFDVKKAIHKLEKVYNEISTA